MNGVRLLAEEVDEQSDELLGNFRQPFSHLGPVNAALAIAEARQGTARRQPAPGSGHIVPLGRPSMSTALAG